jgi:hypothetical protein
MTTQQPVWKFTGHIGDVDPIAYGGAFVYQDETGVYGPEMTFFEPASDEQWHNLEGQMPVTVYRILLERNSENEWWYEKLSTVATYIGQTVADLQDIAKGTNTLALAQLYSDLISYFGAHQFDSYPVTMTEDEAYARYAMEMKAIRR